MKMTIVCQDCETQYGRWRPRCPNCGTPRPEDAVDREERHERKTRATKPRAHKHPECIVCRRHKGKKVQCPECREFIHKACLRLHRDDCARFQVERDAILKNLETKLPVRR